MAGLFNQLKSDILDLTFSPDGCTLAATSDRNLTVGMWDLRADTFRRWHPHVDGFACSLAYSPDGKMLAVGGEIGLVLPYLVADDTYDTECDAGGHLWEWHPSADAVAFARRTKVNPVLATASFEVRLWDFTEGSFWGKALPTTERAAYFGSLAWSADDLRLAAGDADTRSVTVWKLDDRFGLVDHWPIHLGHAWPKVAFAPHGYSLLVTDTKDSIALYDTTRLPKQRPGWRAHHPGVAAVAFHPEGKLLATGGADGRVRFWDVATQRQRSCYDWDVGRIRALVFSPDGMTCAAGGSKGGIAVWDVDA